MKTFILICILAVSQILPAGAQSMMVQNAGSVLFNSYVPILLQRLSLTESNEFVNSESQERCVQVLYYVSTGSLATTQHSLALSKVMCGFDPSNEVNLNQEISTSEKALIDSLLNSMISHWPAIGSATTESLRENFLIRDGFLNATEHLWNLNIEKRSYDILISRSPFSFSVIKYPWMPLPLYVTWPN